MNLPPAVVIGASTGGVNALFDLTAALPANFPAVVAVVLHVGNRPSMLPALINRRSPNPALHPQDGEVPVAGKIYVAPPDHHMLLHPKGIRLGRGALENHARPAIDPLFRTAAIGWRARAIGVVLTGHLDDGTAGLAAIKECGGIAVVQDPATAIEPSMPASALANVAVDHCVSLDRLPGLLEELVKRMPQEQPLMEPPERLLREQAVFEGQGDPVDQLESVGLRSNFSCPECGGSLWEVQQGNPLRYRCHTGHGYSAGSLEYAQAQTLDQSLASSFRLLQEREMLLRRLAAVADATGSRTPAQAGRQAAERVAEHARQLQKIILSQGGGA
jgi:two-component system chemotaxis response regulator CheB